MIRLPVSEMPAPPLGKDGWPWTDETPALPRNHAGGGQWPKSCGHASYIKESSRTNGFVPSLFQGYPNLEYIVIDGGSSDDSVDTILKYEAFSFLLGDASRTVSRATPSIGFERSIADKLCVWLNR